MTTDTLTKTTLVGMIRRTERDTFVYHLDGEDHVYPSFRSASAALSTAMRVNNLTLNQLKERMGLPTAPVIVQTRHGEAELHTSPGTRRVGYARKQQRSIRVELPQAAITELLKHGRTKIMLAVR